MRLWGVHVSLRGNKAVPDTEFGDALRRVHQGGHFGLASEDGTIGLVLYFAAEDPMVTKRATDDAVIALQRELAAYALVVTELSEPFPI